MKMFDLTDRVALVSGTASGMGQAMATVFAEAGAHVVLLDVNTAGNEATADTLSQLGRRAIPVTCDVSSYEQLDRVYALIDREFGHLDILGNVAGNGIQKAAEEITMEEFVGVFQSLVFGRYYSTQQAGRRTATTSPPTRATDRRLAIGAPGTRGREHRSRRNRDRWHGRTQMGRFRCHPRADECLRQEAD